MQATTLSKTLRAQGHFTLRSPRHVLQPARASLPGGATNLDITLPWRVALNVAVVASVCGVLAAIAPARRAAAMDPAQPIRL